MSFQEKDKKLLYLWILSSIFLLNDFLFALTRTYVGWLAVDYGSRILAILIMSYLVLRKKSSFSDFGLAKIGIRPFILWSLVLSGAGIFIDQVLSGYLAKILPQAQLFHYPEITNHFIKVFDLTFGILLVSVSEETIFRGYYVSVLRPHFKNEVVFVAVSSILFGLIHWSHGLSSIGSTALSGILPLISVIRTGSILPALVAHYVTDFIWFFK